MDRFIDDSALENNHAVQSAEYGKGNKALVVKTVATCTENNPHTPPPTNTKGKGKSFHHYG